MQGRQIDRDQEVRQLAYEMWQEAGVPTDPIFSTWWKPRRFGGKPRMRKKAGISQPKWGNQEKPARL